MKRAVEFFVGGTVVYLAMAACSAGGPSLGDDTTSDAGSASGNASAMAGAGGHEGGIAGTDGGVAGHYGGGSGGSSPSNAGSGGGIFDPVPPAMAGPKSGSRLKAIIQKGADGSEMPTFRWRDTERNEDCFFQNMPDGTTRCLPTGAMSAGFFADSGCTIPAAYGAAAPTCGAPPPRYATTSEAGACGFTTRYFELGGLLTAVYQRVGASCFPMSLPAGFEARAVGAEVPLSAFVEAHNVVEP